MSNLELTIRLKAALGDTRKKFEEVTNAGNALTRRVRDLRKELKDLNGSQKNLDKFASSSKSLNVVEKNLQDVQSKMGNLAKKMSALGVPTERQVQQFSRLAAEESRLSQRKAELNGKVSALSYSLKKQGIDTKNLTLAQANIATKLAQTTSQYDKQKAALDRINTAQSKYQKTQQTASNLRSAATSAAIKGTATMAAMSVPVRAYAESETASTDLRVAMMDSSGKVPAEYQKLDQLATKLGNELPGTTADFKNLMTMLMRQGLSAQSVLGGTGEAAALLAVQLKQTPEAAAEMAAKLQDVTRGTEKEMTAIMDSVQRMFYSGVDVENIVPAFTNLAPALDIMKIKGDGAMKQLSPLIGMLDQAGLSGERAGNALRKVFQSSMDTEKIAKATKGSGIDLNFTDGKGEFAGMENMYKELAKMKNLTTEARLAILKDIWGDDSETLQALNTMIEKGQAGYDEFSQKMANQASLQQRVNVQLGTLTNLWDAATGSFTNLMASMGESIAPELKSITEWIASINGAMSNWAARNPALAGAIMKTVAAVGLLFLAFAGIAAAVATFLGPFAFLRLALVQVGPLFASAGGIITKLLPILNLLKMGLLAVGRAFLANPIVLVIAAIAAALYLLWKHWDTVKAALITGWNWIQQTFAENPILNFIFPVIGAARLLVNNWDLIKQALVDGWNWIQQTFANNPILNFIFPVIGIARLLINNWAAIGPFFQQLWASVLSVTSNVWNGIKTVAIAAWNALINWVRNTSAYQAIVSQWNNITGFLGSLRDTLFNLGARIIGGLIDGIASKFGALKSKWNTVASMFNGSYKGTATVNSVASTGAAMAGFSSGGYTGNGGRNAVAGIVHRGEGVLNQAEINSIGGESGFNRLRGLIRTWGSRGISMLASGGLGQVKSGGLISRGLALLDGGSSQERPKFRDAISVNAAMATAGGAAPSAAGMGNFSVTIHIHGGSDNAETIAATVERKFREMKAEFERKNKTSFWDKD